MPSVQLNEFSDVSDATEAYVIVEIDPGSDRFQVGAVGWVGKSDTADDVEITSFDPGGPTETPLSPGIPYEIAGAVMAHGMPGGTVWAPKGLRLRLKFPISAPAAPDGTGEVTFTYEKRPA